MPRSAACLLSLSLLAGLPAAGQEPEKPPAFADEITVALVPVVVRVVDTWGRPILGLQPSDFRVRAGKREIPVEGIDWISAETAPPPATGAVEAPEIPAPAVPPRLIVFFVQADLNPSRISGQLRLRPYTEKLLATLAPGDRVAVVSYDSHLKLWQDFTADRGAVHAAVDQAMLFAPPPATDPGDPVSLADHFDAAAARRAASPERALELTARALAPFAGEKTMVFLGWGLGRFSADGTRATPAFRPAVQALRAAHVSVFVLDVTSADEHSLAAGLEGVADATGGLYLSTFRLPGLATEVLSKAISGYYVLTLDRALLPADPEDVSIELRGRTGTVLARPVSLR